MAWLTRLRPAVGASEGSAGSGRKAAATGNRRQGVGRRALPRRGAASSPIEPTGPGGGATQASFALLVSKRARSMSPSGGCATRCLDSAGPSGAVTRAGSQGRAPSMTVASEASSTPNTRRSLGSASTTTRGCTKSSATSHPPSTDNDTATRRRNSRIGAPTPVEAGQPALNGGALAGLEGTVSAQITEPLRNPGRFSLRSLSRTLKAQRIAEAARRIPDAPSTVAGRAALDANRSREQAAMSRCREREWVLTASLAGSTDY